jgi:hypothetical protein
MNVVVFHGPTISRDEVKAAAPHAVSRPPAGQGDLFRAARDGAQVIALIDGTFERGPAVWHKEILHALQDGVVVAGAASMGALRAAECGPFGMRGIGPIAAWYADGTLTDDDEVTVAHLDAEHDWRCISEAMVNIRTTLASAVGQGVLTGTVATRLIAIAKATYYPERSWPRLLADAGAAGIDVAALTGWLPGNRIDRKNRDAHELLAQLRTVCTGSGPAWRLERSRVWLRASAAMADGEASDGLDVTLDALRIDDAFYELHQAAFLRHLAVSDARRHGVDPDPDAGVDELREALGLRTAAELDAWCAANRLDRSGLRRLAVDQARLAWAHRHHAGAVRGAIGDQLRIRGWYPDGAVDEPETHSDLDASAAWQWYAETRDAAGRGWPDPARGEPERAALATHLGFDDPADFGRAVLRAYRLRRP